MLCIPTTTSFGVLIVAYDVGLRNPVFGDARVSAFDCGCGRERVVGAILWVSRLNKRKKKSNRKSASNPGAALAATLPVGRRK